MTSWRAMKKIAVLNQKGGTGKTTTAAMIASGLSRRGKNILLVDLDPQGSLAIWFNLKPVKSMYHIIAEGADWKDCALDVKEGLLVIPSNRTLAQAEIGLASAKNRELALKTALQSVSNIDYVILDCAPSLNLLNLNAMMYSDMVFVPVAMDYFSLIGVKEVLYNLKLVNKRMGHGLKIGMVIPTFYDGRDRKSREVLSILHKHFKGVVSDPVRKNVKLSEAVGAHMDIFEFAPDSHGAQDYSKIIDRMINA